MKVLHIINSLATGGAEKLLIDSLPKYQDYGVEVDLLLLNGKEHPFLKSFQDNFRGKIFSLGTKSVYNIFNVFKIIKYLNKYDIVHVHLFPSQYFVVFAKIISLSKTQLIFTEHNTSNRRLQNYIFRKFDKLIYGFYKNIVCISEEIREILIKHTHLDKSRFVLIENGIDLSKINNVKPLQKNTIDNKINSDDKILIQVSGFRKQKDQKTLIRALLHLPEYIKLVLVGDGVLKNECEAYTRDLGLSQRVVFLGQRLDVLELLKTSDIVVLSSNYEGLSLSSIEGMASNKPFLASNVPGLREIVKDAGILFSLGNDKEIAQNVNNLLLDSTYYNMVVDKCLARASSFDIIKMVKKHIQLYKQCQ